MSDWDAIIVGAGPAGSALACRLRPAHRVLLVERRVAMDGAPRIGESLPGAARVLLQRCGVLDGFLSQGHAVRGGTVSQWDSEALTWFDPVRDPSGPGWHLDRARFDAGLRAAAVAAGAVLIYHAGGYLVAHEAGRWRVELPAPTEVGACAVEGQLAGPMLRAASGSHRAPVLIDASGRAIAVARRLGMKQWSDDPLTCLYVHLPVRREDGPGPEDQTTRICADRNGWWYSVRTPSGERVLAFHLDRDDAELKALRDPAYLLAKARRHEMLAEGLSGTAEAPVHARPAGSAWLSPEAVAAQPDGFYAIGDAFLAFDPLASQGIFNALAMAESVASALAPGAGTAAMARARHLDEVRAVCARYREHLRATYGAVGRFAGESFWARRASERASMFA